jgi:very-short-patch-repair endonuclease
MDISLARRRRLRREGTDAEAALWRFLRGRRLGGYKFRRQHPLGPFILDFFCSAQRLAVEIDGGQHFEPRLQSYDRRRTEYLASRGVTVIRFRCDRVLREMEAVLTAIAFALGNGDGPSP